MRVWAKNQLRFEIFEKICKNLNGKLIFTHFLSHLQDFCHFIHLFNIPKLGGGLVAPGMGVGYFRVWGVGGCINPCMMAYIELSKCHRSVMALQFSFYLSILLRLLISDYYFFLGIPLLAIVALSCAAIQVGQADVRMTASKNVVMLGEKVLLNCSIDELYFLQIEMGKNTKIAESMMISGGVYCNQSDVEGLRIVNCTYSENPIFHYIVLEMEYATASEGSQSYFCQALSPMRNRIIGKRTDYQIIVVGVYNLLIT